MRILIILFLTAITANMLFSDLSQYKNRVFHASYFIESIDLVFSNDNRFYLNYGSEGVYWNMKGGYKLSNDSIYLYPTECRGDRKFKPMMIGIVSADTNSLYYLTNLYLSTVNKEEIFYNRNFNYFPFTDSTVPTNSVRYYGDVKLITMGLRHGVTIEPVAIRDKPGTNSKKLKFFEDIYGEPKSSVPGKTDVIIIARTEIPAIINDLTNYWYFVIPGDEGLNNPAWMFGEYIRITN